MQAVSDGFVLKSLTDEIDDLTFALGQCRDLVRLRIRSLSRVEQVGEHLLGRATLKPHAAFGYLANRDRNLLNRPLALNHSFCAAAKGSFQETRVFAAGK